jgi:hypothetical protein
VLRSSNSACREWTEFWIRRNLFCLGNDLAVLTQTEFFYCQNRKVNFLGVPYFFRLKILARKSKKPPKS